MNILYFVRNFPKLSESFVLNEVCGLKQQGHDVAVFAQQRPSEEIHHEEYEQLDVPVRYAKRPTLTDVPGIATPEIINHRVLGQCLYRAHPKHHAKSLLLARQCIEFIEDLDRDIDHIHGHFANNNKIPAAYVAAYYGISCTVTAHAAGIFANPNPRMLHVLFDRFDRIIVPSRYNRSYLREQFGVTKPVDVVPATTRVSKFEPTDHEIPTRLFTVARLTEKKGIVYAIEAVARLVNTYPDIEYHIVGTGELEDDLRRHASDLGVANQVSFLGNVSDERLRQEYDEAAAFVLPCVIAADGDRDGSPVVIKEAMAMKTPCISTTVTGIPEMIDDSVNGHLVEPRDTDALAAAIVAIFDDDEDRKRMGEKARETIREDYSLEVAVGRLLTSFGESNIRK